MEDIDTTGNSFVDQLRLPEVGDVSTPPTKKSPQKKRKWKTYFVIGPTWWWKLSARLKCRAVPYVALVLWRQARMTGDFDAWIKIKNSELAEYGIDRAEKCRALGHLKAAGLVCVRGQDDDTDKGHGTIECRIDWRHDPDGTKMSCQGKQPA